MTILSDLIESYSPSQYERLDGVNDWVPQNGGSVVYQDRDILGNGDLAPTISGTDEQADGAVYYYTPLEDSRLNGHSTWSIIAHAYFDDLKSSPQYSSIMMVGRNDTPKKYDMSLVVYWDGSVVAYRYDGSIALLAAAPAGTIVTGQTYQVIVTDDSVNTHLYINGVLMDSQPSVAGAPPASSVLGASDIEGPSSKRSIWGSLSNVATVQGYAWNQTEVTELYEAISPAPEPDLIRNIWAGDNVDANQGLCLGLGTISETVISCGGSQPPEPTYPAKPDFTTMTLEGTQTVTLPAGYSPGANSMSAHQGKLLVRPPSGAAAPASPYLFIDPLTAVGTPTPIKPDNNVGQNPISDYNVVLDFASGNMAYSTVDLDGGATATLTLPNGNGAPDNMLFGNNGLFYGTRKNGSQVAGWKEFNPLTNSYTGNEIAKADVGFAGITKFDSDNYVYHTGSGVGTLYRCSKTSDGASMLETPITGSPSLQVSDKAAYLDGKVYVYSGSTLSTYGVS